MNSLRLILVVALASAALAAGGCFKMDVNLNAIGGGGSGKDTSSPSQLPAVGSGGWKDIAADIAGKVFMATERGVVFYAFDTLAYPNEPVHLSARLQSERLKGIKGAAVAFYEGDKLVALAKTNDDGLADTIWTPQEAGDHKLTAKITDVEDVDDDDYKDLPGLAAPLLVAARKKTAEFVVIDLDHTVVASSFFRVLVGGAKPMAESVRVTKRIAGRYSIIYLTHRPDLLTRKSKTWLSDNGYPTGPLLVSELKEAFGDSGKFKTAKLKGVRKSFPNVKIGIGDKHSDAQAYVDNGLVAYLIPHYKEKPKNMRTEAKAIRKLRGRGRLNVVSGWDEIEAGIFKGKTYPPKTFANWLDRRADLLKAEEKRREEEDDDD